MNCIAAAITARPIASFCRAASGSQGSIHPPTTENMKSSTRRCTLRSSVAATAALTEDFPTPDAPVTTSMPSTGVGSVELQRGVLHQLLPLVGGVDGPDGARLRAHHHRLGARAVAPVAHPLEEVAVADASGAEEHVVARHEVVAGEHAVEVVAGIECCLTLVVVAGVETPEHLATHALQRRGGDDALGRAADAEEDVGATVGCGDGDRRGDVAVLDELDARAGLAALLDDVVVAGTVEHD